jgi:hypothetical protein
VTTAPRAALGVGALFVGGLLGGLLGSALFARGGAPGGGAPAGERVVVESDPQLRAAIEALTRELRLRAADAPVTVGGAREAVREANGAPAGDFGALAAALDRLTQDLEQARGGVAGGGIGVTPLVLPPPGHRAANLRALLAMDDEEASRQFRLWTYQQVLDRFGRPDYIHEGGRWTYVLPEGNGNSEFTFRFTDGFLSGIYY